MQRSLLHSLLLSLLAAAVGPASAHAPKRGVSPPPPIWVTAYYPAWEQAPGGLPPQKIDFTALSHLIHFAIVPRSDGTIDPAAKDGITGAQSREVVAAAHAAGRKVLICVGGADTAAALRPSLTGAVRPVFVRSLVQFVKDRGYDGVDMDMEPIEDSDVESYARLIVALRARLTAADPKLLLTAATGSQPALFARLKNQFDQINLMTYDLSGAWPGWETWHNAALADGGQKMQSTGEPLPSTQGMAAQFITAGVPRSKLGIGLAFYGYVWSGATAPQQSIQGVTVEDSVSYHTIMDTYYQPARYHWDDRAQASYLSIDSPDPKARRFISYDDEKLCAKKVEYARRDGLGGVIIWQLGDGYRNSQPEKQKDVLLQAVKRAWTAPLP